MTADYALETTIYRKFTTRRFSSGAPFTLAGTPVVSVYENDSITQITAGITLTVDFDGVTGLNHLAIAATAANGYEAGKFYSAVITTGTVDSVSVVGEVVTEFSIEATSALRPTTAGRTLDVAATGEAGIDFTNTNGTLTGQQIGVGAFAAGAVSAAALGSGAITADKIASGAITSAKFATDAINATVVADGTIDAGSIAAGALNGKGDWNVGKSGYSIGTNGIVSTSVAASALDGKGDWNVGKSGYSIGTGGIVAGSFAVNAIAASAIAANALDGKGDWNIGKSGYSLTQAFPSNFALMSITAGGAVTAGTVSDKTGYFISGTKTTLDALNDVAATDIVSAGAITTSGGAVATVNALASGAVAAASIAAAAANKIADHTLRRSFANAVASSDGDTKGFRSLLGAVAKLVNKVSISGTTLTVTEDDDITTLGQQTLSTDATADPISGADTL